MKKLTINGKKYTAEKLPLGKYATVLKGMKKIPQQLAKLQDTKEEEILAQMPSMIAESIDEFALVVATGLDIEEKEVIETFGINDVIESIEAIIEVNDLGKAAKKVGSLFNQGRRVKSGSSK